MRPTPPRIINAKGNRSFGGSPSRFKRGAYPFTISIIPDVAGILWEP